MKVVMLGVRGSTPAPGADFARYGGHTSCVAVTPDGWSQPSLVLDAGTGIRDLTRLTGGRAFRGRVLLSHLHWDHVQGLPFCPVLDHPAAVVDLHLPVEAPDGDAAASAHVDGAQQARDLLARAMSPPHFPITPAGLLGRWRFQRLGGGAEVSCGPVTEGEPGPPEHLQVTVAQIPHKGGTCLGIRVDQADVSLAYVPDHSLHRGGSTDDPTEALISGVDLLIHDGQYTPEESTTAEAYGHSVIDDVLTLADRCQIGRLVLTHHAPDRDDDMMDRLARRYRSTPQGRTVLFAAQGDTLKICAARPRRPTSASRSGPVATILGSSRGARPQELPGRAEVTTPTRATD